MIHMVTLDLDKRDELEPCEAYCGCVLLSSALLEGSAAFKKIKQIGSIDIYNKGSRLIVSLQFSLCR